MQKYVETHIERLWDLVVEEIDVWQALCGWESLTSDEQRARAISASGHIVFAPVVWRFFEPLAQRAATQSLSESEQGELRAVAMLIEAMLDSSSFTLVDLAGTGILEPIGLAQGLDESLLRDVLGDRAVAEIFPEAVATNGKT